MPLARESPRPECPSSQHWSCMGGARHASHPISCAIVLLNGPFQHFPAGASLLQVMHERNPSQLAGLSNAGGFDVSNLRVSFSHLFPFGLRRCGRSGQQ